MSAPATDSRNTLWTALLALAVFFAAGALLRPLWPVDETRYMTVAWEMWLSGDDHMLSLNFAPYHHKPPLLFWLINLSWAVFGVSRWAGMAPVFIAASAFIWLTRRLAAMLLPDDARAADRATWLALGSAPFLIYASMIMFDITLAVFVLAALLCFLSYARGGSGWLPLAGGLLLGLGVLTKGPVAALHVLWPLLLYPFWRPQDAVSPGVFKWYAQVMGAVLAALLPVAVWLYPLYLQADDKFLEWLLWRQTAGRIAGDFKAAHARPVYFYLMVLPVILVPWGLRRVFWSGLADLRHELRMRREFRFLLCWLAPVFISFCIVSGKQPHYLVPLLPGVFVVFAWAYRPVAVRWLRGVAIGVVGLLVVAHMLLSVRFFKAYDLTPIAQYVAAHPDHDWGYVRNYQGELGFLGRLENVQFESLEGKQVHPWFRDHPDGWVIMRRTHRVRHVDDYEELFSMPYRGRHMGVYRLRGDMAEKLKKRKARLEKKKSEQEGEGPETPASP